MNKKTASRKKIRKARMEDIPNIRDMINTFAKKNVMLPRSLNELYENIRDFWVVEDSSGIKGCCALHPLWGDMAEIKSLAVLSSEQGKNLGRRLVTACEKECSKLGITKVFALTYVPEFFSKMGYERGKKETMPHKIWSECIKCPHFPDCDEILVEKLL